MKACPQCGQKFLGTEEFCPKDGTTLVEIDRPQEDPLIGTTLDGRYAVEKKIGEGGMGMVYLAKHAVIGKQCAIKVLRQELSGESEVSERFIQEARSAAAIGNQHIIEITDFGQTPDGSAFFVMEYLDGLSLKAVLEESFKLDLKRAMHILKQCCIALQAAHQQGIVHRDLKPENLVLITRGADSDFVKILDFGIAKVARETGRLTRTGMIFGTPQYMSPEQAAGTDIDARTDIYSLGIIFYEMLCGHCPFEADTFMGVLTKHLYEEPIPPRRLVPPVEMPQSAEAVMLKAISKKPDRRYGSMTEFGEDVQALLEGKTPSIVYDQMRDSATTAAPPPPSEVVGATRRRQSDDDDEPISGFQSRLPMIIGAVTLVAIVIIVTAVLLSGGDDPEKAHAEALTDQPKDTNTGPVAPAVPETPDRAETVEAAENAKPIKLSSTPTGVRLYKDGMLIGQLPLEVPRPPATSEGVVYHLKKEGYQDEQIKVANASPDAFTHTLTKDASSAKASVKDTKGASSDSTQSSTRRTKKKRKKSSAEETPAKQKKKRKKRVLGSDLADPWAN